MGLFLDDKIKEWINIPAVLTAKSVTFDKNLKPADESFRGVIQYGVRLPIRSATTPLVTCETGSRERIEGEKPAYWFVSFIFGETIKIKLLTAHIDKKEGIVYGRGYDTNFFKYIIKKKE